MFFDKSDKQFDQAITDEKKCDEIITAYEKLRKMHARSAIFYFVLWVVAIITLSGRDRDSDRVNLADGSTFLIPKPFNQVEIMFLTMPFIMAAGSLAFSGNAASQRMMLVIHRARLRGGA